MVVNGTKAIVDVDVGTRIKIIINRGVDDVVGFVIIVVDEVIPGKDVVVD